MNNKILKYFLIVTAGCVMLNVGIPSFSFAQKNYFFEHISIPDGLSNAQVWDIKQDQYGFLWIATSDGLNSYDGYNFKIYKNDPGDQNSLPNNNVNSLMIDLDGTLWVGTSAGFSKFNRANESFETMLLDSNSVDPSSNNITKIVQDSKSRIWLLSDESIFKFDKKTNKIKQEFLKDGEKKLRVRLDNFAFLETSSGEIYTGYHFKGLIKYNESDKLFEWVNVDPKNPTIFEHHSLLNLYEDKTGKIWISSQNGFYSYDPQTGNFDEINLFKKVSNVGESLTNGIGGVYQDDKGFLWIATITNGIFLYDMKTSEIITLNEAELPVGVHNFNAFWKFFRDEFGILWIATGNNGLLKLDFQKEPFRLFTNPIDKTNANKILFVSSIHQTSNEKDFIWLGTDEGLIKYSLNDKTYRKHKNINGDPNQANNSVRSIRQGFSQELWLGTRNGLSKMNMLNNTFTNYDLSDNSKFFQVDHNNIYDLSMDDYGDLWIAANLTGVVKFDSKNKTRQFIPTQNVRTYNLSLFTAIDSLSKNNYAVAKLVEVGDSQDLKKEFNLQKQTDVMIVSVGEGETSPGMMDYGWLQDSNSDTIWIDNDYAKSLYVGGGYKNRIHIGILSLKKGDYTLRYISDEGHSYGKWNTDPPVDSTLWGIQVFDLTGSDVNYYKSLLSSSENQPFINSEFVRKVEYQNDGSVFIGTNSGLYKYDIRKKSIENLQSDSKIFASQNLKQINDILVDKDKVAWIATNGGLIKYDQQSNKFKILYDKDGLPSNYIQAIEEDNYGNLWMSTLNGISKFNKETDHPIFINYDVKDGLQGYAFNIRASFRSESGDLFFAGQNGFNTFHSSNINKQLPKIEITQLKISNKLVTPSSENSPLIKSILDTKSIELTYSQNSISFDFTAIHFSKPEKNQYAYMLEGFDKDGWIYDNRRFATYTNIPPGEYIFRVKGSNGDGVWNDTGATINIKVLAPWWRTIWAYIGYVLCFGLVVLGVDKFQRRRLIEKERTLAKEKEFEQAKEIEKAYTELKSTQAQLIHAEKMASLGELTAGIAHEIKNPLNFVNNFSEVSNELVDEIKELLQKENNVEGLEIVEDLKQNLEKINQHGKRADSIVKGMLLHSRGTSGEKTLTDINDLLDQYVNLAYHGMRAQNKEFNITIEKDYDSSIDKINVVPQDISRVFLNIINNACYAAFDKKKKGDNNFSPTLIVSTKKLNNKVEIRIGDNGNGIPADILDKIFQPFFSTKPTGEGTGLGLSLSYDIVTKVHGGDLKVETKVNEGSQFIIQLPLY